MIDRYAGAAFLPLPVNPSQTNVFEAGLMLSRVEPPAWLTDILERMVSGRTKAHELERLLPWHWKAERLAAAVDA